MGERRKFKQPELTDDWGCPYYGKAKTVSGDVWWHEWADGSRQYLRPKEYLTEDSPMLDIRTREKTPTWLTRIDDLRFAIKENPNA